MSRVRERGAAALEVVGTLPILILAAMVAFQIGLVGWTAVETGEAAKVGARSSSLGKDPRLAVDNSLPGSLEAIESSGQRTEGGVRYTVRVPIPSVVPISLGSVTRSVEMPVTS